MSIHKNMIINFLVPVFTLIVATTTLGTICLKHIKDKNRDILCESVDSTSHAIANGIIMNNGQNIDKFITDKEILTSYYLKTSSFTNQLKCCEDQVRTLKISNGRCVNYHFCSTKKIISNPRPTFMIPSLTLASCLWLIYRIHLQRTAQTTIIQTSKTPLSLRFSSSRCLQFAGLLVCLHWKISSRTFSPPCLQFLTIF